MTDTTLPQWPATNEHGSYSYTPRVTVIPMALFSVDGGKFHRPAAPFDRAQAWRPTLTACGRIVAPQNYFATEADADRHTGGRLVSHLCKHCAEG